MGAERVSDTFDNTAAEDCRWEAYLGGAETRESREKEVRSTSQPVERVATRGWNRRVHRRRN